MVILMNKINKQNLNYKLNKSSGVKVQIRMPNEKINEFLVSIN